MSWLSSLFSTSSSKVVTRFPPSPTGYFHIGSARTALFNYLFAAKNGGAMYLRFEDTDVERSKKEYEKDILEGLEWLGISYNKAEHLRQSEKTHVYVEHVKKLIANGHAYEAEAAEGDASKKVVRFKNPNVRVEFKDLIRGDVSFDTTELKDFVIAKSISEPLYHLAVVIDDHDMGITHVIRGEDHISNTARQILILEALGFKRPMYAHIPLILAPDRSKLSKRHGAVSVNEYRAQGFLPEALVNYLALLGWNPGGERELFSLDELVREFDISKVQKGGAIFDVSKLRWFNREYLLKLPDSTLKEKIGKVLAEAIASRGHTLDDSLVQKLMPVIKERIEIWGDINTQVEAGEYDFFFTEPSPSAATLPGKKSDAATAREHLTYVKESLEKLSDTDFANPDTIKNAIWDYATEKGRAQVLWPFRYALTGRERSPDPFQVASIVGKMASIGRLNAAIGLLSS